MKKTMNKKYLKNDFLAVDRTHLANERTFLAYSRTALAFLVSGSILIKFYPTSWLMIIGVGSIIFGILLFLYGIKKHIDWKKRIDKR